MATVEKKAQRRQVALNELKRLSELIAEQLNVEVPDVSLRSNNDPELAQITQIEAINALLSNILAKTGNNPGEGSALEGLTKAELMDKAAQSGIEVPKSAKKAEIIEALSNEGSD